jgi:predicted exporter
MIDQKKEAEELAIYEYDIALFLIVAGLLVGFFFVASRILNSSAEERRRRVLKGK